MATGTGMAATSTIGGGGGLKERGQKGVGVVLFRPWIRARRGKVTRMERKRTRKDRQ